MFYSYVCCYFCSIVIVISIVILVFILFLFLLSLLFFVPPNSPPPFTALPFPTWTPLCLHFLGLDHWRDWRTWTSPLSGVRLPGSPPGNAPHGSPKWNYLSFEHIVAQQWHLDCINTVVTCIRRWSTSLCSSGFGSQCNQQWSAWCGVQNAFGVSVYPKEYMFPILLISWKSLNLLWQFVL